jgi:hypothetical protein
MWKSARYNIYCSSFGRIALAEGSALCGLRGFASIDRLLLGGGDLLGTPAAPEMAAFAYAHGPLGVAEIDTAPSLSGPNAAKQCPPRWTVDGSSPRAPLLGQVALARAVPRLEPRQRVQCLGPWKPIERPQHSGAVIWAAAFALSLRVFLNTRHQNGQ